MGGGKKGKGREGKGRESIEGGGMDTISGTRTADFPACLERADRKNTGRGRRGRRKGGRKRRRWKYNI